MNELILNLRREYSRESLDEHSTEAQPVRQFEKWFTEALKADLPEPHAMMLSTVNEQGRPSARIVLLRGGLPEGFLFFTNYQSHKGSDLARQPYAALTFFWPELERQIRIEGKVSNVQETVSDEYFAQRPRGSQIGAWASPQSSIIVSREILSENEQAFEQQFDGKQVPRPPHWGGFMLHPDYFEFWQGRPNRLHDRICYQLDNQHWSKFRIAP
jgi:pyridoxamine 5'-phosphate oxidase